MAELIILIAVIGLLTFVIVASERKSFQLNKTASMYITLVKFIIIGLVGMLFLLLMYIHNTGTIIDRNTKELAKDTSLVKVVNISEDDILTLEDGSKIRGSSVKEYSRTAYGTGSYYNKSSGLMVSELTYSDVRNTVMLGNCSFLYVILIILGHMFVLKYHNCSHLSKIPYMILGVGVCSIYIILIDSYSLFVVGSSSLVDFSMNFSNIVYLLFIVLCFVIW